MRVRQASCSAKEALALLVEKIGQTQEVEIATESAAFFQNGEVGSFELIVMGSALLPMIRLRWTKPSLRVPTQHKFEELIETWDGKVETLFTFAHEFGHYLSYRRKERSCDYESALAKWNNKIPTSKREQGLIIREEEIAWSYGISTLRGLGFKKTKVARSIKKRALQTYRLRLRISPKSRT
jgi:hypothetical protein